MALSKIDVSNMLDETLPVANGGTGVTTSANLANTGNLVKISTATLSGDQSAEFDLDSTFEHFLFRMSKLHASADTDAFKVDFSLTSDTDYGGATITYAVVRDFQSESSGNTASNINNFSTGTLGNVGFINSTSADDDHAVEGTFEIYNPSSTTFTKKFRGELLSVSGGNNVMKQSLFGDIRNTTAVDKVKFFMESGNFASGKITQYGIKI